MPSAAPPEGPVESSLMLLRTNLTVGLRARHWELGHKAEVLLLQSLTHTLDITVPLSFT